MHDILCFMCDRIDVLRIYVFDHQEQRANYRKWQLWNARCVIRCCISRMANHLRWKHCEGSESDHPRAICAGKKLERAADCCVTQQIGFFSLCNNRYNCEYLTLDLWWDIRFTKQQCIPYTNYLVKGNISTANHGNKFRFGIWIMLKFYVRIAIIYLKNDWTQIQFLSTQQASSILRSPKLLKPKRRKITEPFFYLKKSSPFPILFIRLCI